MLSRVVRGALGPKCAQHFDMLVCHGTAHRKIGAQSSKLFCHPPHAGAYDQSASRNHVQRAQHLRVENRVPVGQDEHTKAQVYPFGHRGQVS